MAKEQHTILVISDNPTLALRFETEVWPLITNPHNYDLEFMCSPFSKVSQFLNTKPISVIDLKNDTEVERLGNYDLILSIHCKQLFPNNLLKMVRCINVHPGYNPYNRGWYPQVFSIINKEIIGATIHEIDEKLDHGPIICREKVILNSWDTSLTLYQKIVDKEISLLKRFINKIITNDYKTVVPEIEGNLYLKKDFNNLCSLDLNEKLTMGEAIDKLRALTHGEYKNAYFKDQYGNKIYVSVNMSINEKS